jgi:hypothetical protein
MQGPMQCPADYGGAKTPVAILAMAKTGKAGSLPGIATSGLPARPSAYLFKTGDH